MEQQNLKQKDLAKYLGGRDKVSKILRGIQVKHAAFIRGCKNIIDKNVSLMFTKQIY